MSVNKTQYTGTFNKNACKNGIEMTKAMLWIRQNCPALYPVPVKAVCVYLPNMAAFLNKNQHQLVDGLCFTRFSQ